DVVEEGFCVRAPDEYAVVASGDRDRLFPVAEKDPADYGAGKDGRAHRRSSCARRCASRRSTKACSSSEMIRVIVGSGSGMPGMRVVYAGSSGSVVRAVAMVVSFLWCESGSRGRAWYTRPPLGGGRRTTPSSPRWYGLVRGSVPGLTWGNARSGTAWYGSCTRGRIRP